MTLDLTIQALIFCIHGDTDFWRKWTWSLPFQCMKRWNHYQIMNNTVDSDSITPPLVYYFSALTSKNQPGGGRGQCRHFAQHHKLLQNENINLQIRDMFLNSLGRVPNMFRNIWTISCRQQLLHFDPIPMVRKWKKTLLEYHWLLGHWMLNVSL